MGQLPCTPWGVSVTSQGRSQCSTCVHFRSVFLEPQLAAKGKSSTCAAFSGGIPQIIYRNGFDHRNEFPGDNGVRWESNGDEFPEYAFSEKVLAEVDE